jgi:hypothetical protein
MKNNVGKTDKIIRSAFGAVVIGFAIMNQSWWGLIGTGIMLPAIMGSDPLYTLLGVNTNSNENEF